MRTDAVTLEILKNHFVAIAEAMGYTLERTSYTTFIKESADFCTAMATPQGEIFAYPRNIGVSSFLGINLDRAIRAFDTYEPGDVVITNDPYSTDGLATHLPDIHLFKPVFWEDHLLCFAWCFIHCSDVGGLVPASISPRAYEIFQEGMRIPPRKFYHRGQLNDDLLTLFLANCRIPEQNQGDLNAMVAALNTAESRMSQVVTKFGMPTVKDGMQDVLDWTEERVRALLATIPKGEYAFADYLDDDMDGIPVRLAVTVRADGGDVWLDFTGTDPQVNSALNLPAFGERHPFLIQGLINYVLSEDPFIPLTGGIVRPFRISAPKGSIVNPEFPVAVGVRYATVFRLYNVVLGALARAVPGKVPAAGAGQGIMIVLSVPDLETGRRQVTVLQPLFGGGGGSALLDGVAATDSSCGFLRNTPVESVEAHIPVLVERYELLPDSGGAGRHRGGWGTCFDFRIAYPDSIVTARGMERCRFAPWGLAGGRAAGTTRAILNVGTDGEREIGRIDVLYLQPGDVVSIWTPGGGGYGDPLERDPVSVGADLRSGLLSMKAAEHDYGIVFQDGEVDAARTAAIRETLSASRNAVGRDVDLGPSRRCYEAVWTEVMSSRLAQLLLGLPTGLRAHAKRELHRRVESGAHGGATDLESMLKDILAELRRVGGVNSLEAQRD